MRERSLDAVLVIGDSTFGNPELSYVCGTQIPRGGIYLKKVHNDPVLIVSEIDLLNARRGHVKNVLSYAETGFHKILAKHGRAKSLEIFLHDQIFRRRIRGKIGVYGRVYAAPLMAIVDELRRRNHQIVAEHTPTLIDSLRETKSPQELEAMVMVARKTGIIIDKVADFLRSCRINGKVLINGGSVLTVGAVKRFIRRILAENELVAPEGIILAVGKRSADPHFAGEESDKIGLKKPIVLDIFPQNRSGYYCDSTRTFVVGRPTKQLKRMHEAVVDAQQLALDQINSTTVPHEIVNRICEEFELRGYPTIRNLLRSRKAIRSGFIHSLGHGIGLTIGERPFLTLYERDRLKQKSTVTVEPGLYDPRVGGVRVEDVVIVERNKNRSLTHADKDLAL